MRNARKNGILLDDTTNELYLGTAGRMSVGNTLYQNQYVLLNSHPGDLKNDPLLGAGIADMPGDEQSPQMWKKTIREQLGRDLLKVQELTVSASGDIHIQADYE